MIDKNLDSEIIKLEQRHRELEDRQEWIALEIDDLESEQNDIEYEMERIETSIAEIKKKMLMQKIEELNNESDDKFTMDFIKASFFTNRWGYERPILSVINVTDCELQALDGFRAIIIKNNDIPLELQNKRFNWKTRENFIENVSNVKDEFINIKKIIPSKEEATHVIHRMTTEYFKKFLKCKLYEKEPSRNLVQLSYKDFKITFNEDYINDALMVLKGSVFSVYFYSNVSPMYLETENMQIVVLPVRLCE